MHRVCRVAYCTQPEGRGVFAFYKNLRRALEPHGTQVFAVSVGPRAAAETDPRFRDEHCVSIAPTVLDVRACAKALVEWFEGKAINIVMPANCYIAHTAIPFMPRGTHVVQRCNSITRQVYDVFTNHRAYVSQIVATSKRQYEDLEMSRRIPPRELALIAHGYDLGVLSSAAKRRHRQPGRIRLGYVGRLEHADKGCLYLPAILRSLDGRSIDYTLDIVGDGPDRSRLEHAFRSRTEQRVRFHGMRAPSEVLQMWSEIDVLLLTSHFEGFPNSLGEAMGAGCVPIVSRISGVTDWIVAHDTSGFVCPVGDARTFADAVAKLHRSPERLEAMAAHAQHEIQTRFGLERFGDEYQALFDRLCAAAPNKPAAPDWSSFRVDPAFLPTWRRFVPRRVKSFARRIGILA